ncbi:MAG: hypothetical protein IT370_00495 [Deltaproteobacteria bacterium]|nr:hypothetical protein [Deltaproteobacteria bacterium]
MRALVCLALCVVVCGCRSVDRDKVARRDACRGVVQRWQIFAEDLERAADGGYAFTTTRSAGELALQQWTVAEAQLMSICWPEPHWKAGDAPAPSRHGPLKELSLAILRGDLVAARERAKTITRMLESLAAPR